MKIKIIIHLFSCISGTAPVYALLKVNNYFYYLNHAQWEIDLAEGLFPDFLLMGIFFVSVLAIQLGIILPIFNRLTKLSKLTLKNIVVTGCGFIIFGSLLFGLTLGSLELGIIDVLTTIGIGLLVFLIFYLVDFYVYFKLTNYTAGNNT